MGFLETINKKAGSAKTTPFAGNKKAPSKVETEDDAFGKSNKDTVANNKVAPKAPSKPAPKAPGKPAPKAPTKPVPKAPGLTKPTPKKVEEVKEEKTKVEEIKTADLVNDLKEEDTKPIKVTESKELEIKEEAKAKPKAQKSSNSKAKENTSKKEDEVSEELRAKVEADVIREFYKVPKTTVKFDTALKSLRNADIIEQEWLDYRSALEAEVNEVVIEADMNDSAIKKMLSKLDTVNDKIRVDYYALKSRYEDFITKNNVEGMIEQIKRLNASGNNDLERQKTGILAVMNHVQTIQNPDTGKEEEININLYEIYRETKDRYYFYESLVGKIDWKANRLITMQGAVKSEKNGK